MPTRGPDTLSAPGVEPVVLDPGTTDSPPMPASLGTVTPLRYPRDEPQDMFRHEGCPSTVDADASRPETGARQDGHHGPIERVPATAPPNSTAIAFLPKKTNAMLDNIAKLCSKGHIQSLWHPPELVDLLACFVEGEETRAWNGEKTGLTRHHRFFRTIRFQVFVL